MSRQVPLAVTRQVAVLCCAVLCCAVLCCAVLCCAVLCCAVHAPLDVLHLISGCVLTYFCVGGWGVVRGAKES